jgi:formylmethanofuran dehydrogenase subunit E
MQRHHRFTLALGLATGMLLALSLSSTVLVPTALAAGGTSIASAPELPIGTTVTGGASAHSEFWRVTLVAGDKLTINFQPVNGGEVYLYVFRPSVTDSSLGDSSDVASGSTSGQSQFTWTATGQGAWILKVSSDHGYQLTTGVDHTTFSQVASGSTIASAPELPISTTFVAGSTGHTEFWRVTLVAGDKLTINFQPVNGGEVYLYVFRPSVTDYTLGDSSDVASGSTSGQSKFTWTATGQGAWILKVSSDHGYRLTAAVKRWTATKLSAPHNVHSGTWFYYRGSVGPSVSSGTVLLQRYVKKSWRTFGTVKIGPKGTFSRRARFVSRTRHQERVRAYYRGDVSHCASRATVRILVR